MSNIQPVVDTVSMENEAKISAMECLLNHCNAGRQTCVRILTAFKIAAVSFDSYVSFYMKYSLTYFCDNFNAKMFCIYKLLNIQTLSV